MDSNTEAQALATNAAIKGARIEAEGDNVIYFVRPEKLLLPVAKFIDSIGGEIENYPLWIEIDDASVEVPVGIKNRMLVAEDETETVKTWTEWRTPLVINDRIFIEMSDGRNYLKMSELTPVLSIIIKPADLPQQIEEL
jgi:hypothetical protein